MYIYDKKTLEIITKLDLTKEDFLKEDEKYFKDYNDETMVISEDYIAYPKLTEDGTLREKTTEEKIIEDKKIELLQDGEYIENEAIKKVEKPKELIKSIWNKEKHIWEEGYTKEQYHKDIDKVKLNILNNGYNWKGHIQRCRDKDITLMTTTIETLKDYKMINKVDMPLTWYFNENDGVEMTLNSMIDLRLTGTVFVQRVYTIENELKTAENFTKDIEDTFKEMLGGIIGITTKGE